MYIPTDRTVHTTALGGRKIAQTANASVMQDRSAMQEDPNLHT